MNALRSRVSRLEQRQTVDLPPRAKAWLGWSLTNEERVAVNTHDDEPTIAEIDASQFSLEARAWLGI
jgi:hypothetical protein